ncbi:flavin reductase family protein [Methylocella silvestris]|uniref:4-hydroxyphenylacetate 3-monooxygenase n=1 Tax=Methylocella silvestris TaxID=199596 RepID=A0A2J7THW0_METSI|nr:flavin reductase family protein [Methylocella silvestris]PNG26354.1 4-hydroxyphenylacetate 3-monooxygenase [Methylocella silvestris]
MAEIFDGAAVAAPVGHAPDSAKFRQAMSRVAASVHIVTTDGPAGLGGITATSMASISADPPMLLFCINKVSASAGRMIENGVFCINTLTPAHQELADVFAGRGDHTLEQRFDRGDWRPLATGAPALDEAVASFDCRLVEAKEVGTHIVMIGLVEAVAYGPAAHSLAYVHRGYRTL